MISFKSIIALNLIILVVAAGLLTGIHTSVWQFLEQYSLLMPLVVCLCYLTCHLLVRFVMAIIEYVAYQRLQ